MEQVTLRRIGGTLYLRVPSTFVHQNNLSHGDSLFWIPKEDSVTLKRVTPKIVAEIKGEETVVEGA
jgi:hypothetical protein